MELISLMHKSAKINCTKISTSKNYYIKNFVVNKINTDCGFSPFIDMTKLHKQIRELISHVCLFTLIASNLN